MTNEWSQLALIDFGIQWGGFALAAILRTEKFYDLFGSLTFISLIGRTLSNQTVIPLPSKIQSGMVLFWASRLGLYLFTRVLKEGEDKRFRQIKTSMPRFFTAWTLQGVWVLVTLAPTLRMLINNNVSLELPNEITPLRIAGWSLYLCGIIIEMVADWQKSSFRKNPANAGKFINSGLWSVSRHPNYFGEMMLWFGLWISSLEGTTLKEKALTSLSPIFVAFLISKVSGIPMLEASANKRWGADPNYQEYKRSTSSLIPFL